MNAHAPAKDRTLDPPSNRILTVPNLLCAIRFVGAFGLVGIAAAGWEWWFLGVFFFLMATDWIDGKLAILLNQRSTFGARFDSVADIAMHMALLTGCVWLRGEVLLGEWVWFVVAGAAYAASCVASRVKFGHFPSYHTRAAKTAWYLVLLAVVALFADSWVAPLRLALAATVLVNIEAMVITRLLPRWRTDVPSAWHAWRWQEGEK